MHFKGQRQLPASLVISACTAHSPRPSGPVQPTCTAEQATHAFRLYHSILHSAPACFVICTATSTRPSGPVRPTCQQQKELKSMGRLKSCLDWHSTSSSAKCGLCRRGSCQAMSGHSRYKVFTRTSAHNASHRGHAEAPVALHDAPHHQPVPLCDHNRQTSRHVRECPC
jgi:hypothetical protein